MVSRKTCGLSRLRLEPPPLLDVRGEVLLAQVVVRPGHEPRRRRRPGSSRRGRGSPTTRPRQARSSWPRPRIATRIRCVGEPERLVAPAEHPPELVGGDAVRRLGHQLDGDEPLPERQVRAVEERARGDAELVPARVAVPLVARVEPEQAVVLVAARALDAARPAEALEVERGSAPRARPACAALRTAGSGSRLARASRRAVTSWVRWVVRISRRSFVCRKGKSHELRRSADAGNRPPAPAFYTSGHGRHQRREATRPPRSPLRAKVAEGRGRWQIGVDRHVRGGGGLWLVRPRRVGLRPGSSGPGLGRSSGRRQRMIVRLVVVCWAARPLPAAGRRAEVAATAGAARAARRAGRCG